MEDGSTHDEQLAEHQATELRVTNVPGITEIRVGTTTDTIKVRATGPDALVARIRQEATDGVLDIEGPWFGGHVTAAIVAHTQNGAHTARLDPRAALSDAEFGVITFGDKVVVGRIGGGIAHYAADALRVVVDVPETTPISILDRYVGDYVVGDTKGPLVVALSGVGSVTAGHVGRAKVTTSDRCTVEIASVVGDRLAVLLYDRGYVRVREGQVDTLDITVQGAGHVGYGGRAADAVLRNTSYRGGIRINEVTGRAQQLPAGRHGSIEVYAGPRNDPSTFWDN